MLITPVPLPPRASITIQPVPVDDDEIRELIRLKLVELRKPQKYLADALGISLPWLWHMMGPNKREFGKYREPILAWLNEPARMSA